MNKFDNDAAIAFQRMQMSTYEKAWYKSCTEVLEKKELYGLRCLDLCCGNGEFANILREKFHMDVVCTDYIPLHLEQARKNGFKTIEINLDDDMTTIQSLAKDYLQSFDIVVNLAAIEHIFNTGNLIGFAHKVLKPNGYFLVNTPNISFAAYLLYTLMRGRPFGEGYHIRFWEYNFLRTNLFLYGFNHFEDYRKFYSLPYNPVLRAFRNRRTIARIITPFFHACKILQHIPFLKGFSADELTILCRKEDVPLVGFELNDVRRNLANTMSENERELMIERLKIARQKGWLDEHLYLSNLVDEFVKNSRN